MLKTAETTFRNLEMIELICTVITIGFFCTGILTSRKIFLKKSVQDVNFLPYVMTALNCLLWLSYGVMVNDNTQIIVNFTGAVLQGLYIMIYFKYLNNFEQSSKNLKVLLSAAFVFAVTLLFVWKITYLENRAQYHGLVCDFFTILMFASPLSTLRQVIITKSTATISLPLSIMVFFVSISWFSYGTIKNDLYVKVPNGFGAVLGLIQISLFLIYPAESSKTSNL